MYDQAGRTGRPSRQHGQGSRAIHSILLRNVAEPGGGKCENVWDDERRRRKREGRNSNCTGRLCIELSLFHPGSSHAGRRPRRRVPRRRAPPPSLDAVAIPVWRPHCSSSRPSLPLCRLSQQVRVHTSVRPPSVARLPAQRCDCPPPPPRLFAGLESSAGSGAAARGIRADCGQLSSSAEHGSAAQRSAAAAGALGADTRPHGDVRGWHCCQHWSLCGPFTPRPTPPGQPHRRPGHPTANLPGRPSAGGWVPGVARLPQRARLRRDCQRPLRCRSTHSTQYTSPLSLCVCERARTRVLLHVHCPGAGSSSRQSRLGLCGAV